MSIDPDDRYFRGGQGGHFLRFMVHPNALRGNKKESRANRHPIKETDLYVKKILAVKHRVTSTFNDDSSPPGLVFFKKHENEPKEERRKNEQKSKREAKRVRTKQLQFFYYERFVPSSSSLHFSIERVVKHSRNTLAKRAIPRGIILNFARWPSFFVEHLPSALVSGDRE